MPIQHMFHQLSFTLIIIISFSQPAIAKDCDLATDLMFRAYALEIDNISQRKLLLTESLQLCPDNPDAHTTLANIFMQQGRHAEAINYYKLALRYNNNFYKAWYGLGEVYYKQKRVPLSLEAHLHACQQNEISKARVMALLNERSYTFTKNEEVLDDHEGLQVLYDKQRQQSINQMIVDCELSEIVASEIEDSQDCNTANDLIFQAYSLQWQDSQRKVLLAKAVQLCPDRPDVHTKLATIITDQPSEAIKHYKQALSYDKTYYKAWYGLGESYYKQRRFSLSLEAHLQACKHEAGSKARVQTLLEKKLYSFTNENEFIDKEGLLVLFDNKRRQVINESIIDCGLIGKIESIHTFLNFIFHIGKSDIPAKSTKQLDEIAAALRKANLTKIIVHGHSDVRKFVVSDRAESDKMNLKLSQVRAEKIGKALMRRGIKRENLETLGHSYNKPLADWSTPSKNRRIEIEVQ